MNKEMSKKIVVYVFFFSLLVYSCRKSIPTDELQGTWIEQGRKKSKLIFSGDTFYFFHEAIIDTSSYTFDSKHLTLWTAPLNNPTSAGKSYQLDYHKKKKILTVIGLFPDPFGRGSKNHFKKR